MELHKIVGLKVIAVRGFNGEKNVPKYIEPQYILFSDKETYIELAEQDYYDYHDCSSFAREVSVWQDSSRWKQMFLDKQHYPEATT